MSKKKNPKDERAIILSQRNKRPYGVKVRIHVLTSASLGDVEHVCISLSTGAFVTIKPAVAAPWDGGKKYLVTLEGFPTAASAEAAGRRLVQALLWMAISINVGLRLEYFSYEPAAVFERDRSEGAVMSGFGTVSTNPIKVLSEVQDAYAELEIPNEKLLLSMEIFCAARLESSQRAVFLSLVSALEPLAQEELLGDDVANFVSFCVAQLRNENTIRPEVRNSLEGRLRQLQRESIGQALRRLVKQTLPDQPDAPEVVVAAYALRSQLIHAGIPSDLDTDLDQEAQSISRLIRSLYASILKKRLAHT